MRARLGERLLLLVNVLVANAAAALWVATFLQPSSIGLDRTAFEVDGRVAILRLDTPAAWLASGLSVALLLWNFAWLVRRRDVQPADNWIVSDTPSGPVRVSREAVEAALRTAGEALPEVTRLRVAVEQPAQRRIRVRGQFHCAEGCSHLAASQRLRQVMVDRFGELVRVRGRFEVEYELEFQGFAGKLAKNASAGELAAAEEPRPFTGPEYPIDDDSDFGGGR